jgi:hypothetical protein
MKRAFLAVTTWTVVWGSIVKWIYDTVVWGS